ncbi:MAG TPA: biotin--[acetyl-CoA-carboxylase] ligase [Mycobacteriales bacterium]|nr:biotin--[acetyl-CoA-carboxylase] ligase [Mycobacteriales bacterium]
MASSVPPAGRSPWADLDRPPLRVRALRRALEPDGWRVEVLERTGSTNAVVAERARAGEPAGLVVVAELQTAGRGRLDRTWQSPPRAGLTFSVLLRPTWPEQEWPWLPLLTGLAVARALREQAELEAVLKWPNDVLVADRKLCGVLAEVPLPGAAVVGMGLNVTTRADELPHDRATSVRLEEGATTDRETLLRAVLRALRDGLADPGTARAQYRALCTTIGRQVAVELPSRPAVTGTAERVDDAGQLVVDGIAYAAGDVVHAGPLTP